MHWIRFERGGQTGFGTLRDGVIQVHEGDMFAGARATNATVPLAEVTLLTPCMPTKMIALWNNFHALAAKLNLSAPPEPLYLLKAPNSFLAGGQTIRVPASYLRQGRVRRRARGRDRQASLERFRGRRDAVYLRLHLFQRRHRRRNPPERSDLRPVDARQGLRHFRRVRPGASPLISIR